MRSPHLCLAGLAYSFFIFALLVDRATQKDVEFDWAVTEEVPFPRMHPAEDRCPRKFKPYVIVVAGTNHDANWTKTLGEDVETVIMQQNNHTEPQYYTRRGNEAGAYLTFMVDYYNCLPEVTAFIHGHEHEGWHNFPMLETMGRLQWHLIPGYTDLNRKPGIWTRELRNRPKTPSHHPIATGDDVYDGSHHPATIFGGEAYDGWETMMYWSVEVAVQAYDRFFGRAGLGAMPRSVSFACCSQFAVTNVTIRSRSRFFWEQNLHYLKHNNIEHDNDHSKTYMVGDIWTHFWPMLFGKGSDYQVEIPDHELFSEDPRPRREISSTVTEQEKLDSTVTEQEKRGSAVTEKENVDFEKIGTRPASQQQRGLTWKSSLACNIFKC